jgi:hypothetical protein
MDAGRGTQIKAALDARVAEIRRQHRSEQPASGQQQPPAKQGPADDAAWAERFRASLAAASVLSDLDGKRGELGRAIADRVITPATASALGSEYTVRRRELQQQPEPAGATA